MEVKQQPDNIDAEANEAPLTMNLTSEGQRAFTLKSCFDCQKFNVCYIWRTLNEVLKQNNAGVDKQKLPIQVEDLANICSQYYAKGLAVTKLTP